MFQEYIDFLRFCIDDNQPVPDAVEDINWSGLARFMKKQALLGVGFRGIKKLKEWKMGVPKKVLVKWYAMAEQIERQNRLMDERTCEAVKHLRNYGFECCVLKGQGNAQLYPWPSLRSSGDIDVWVSGDRKEIMAFAKKEFPDADIRFHHVSYPIFAETDVELHFTPASMNNPWYNRRLQQWFMERQNEQFHHSVYLSDNVEAVPVPTTDFNIVYQLTHLMHHFFDEGIGLRQMMDYYFLLVRNKELGVKSFERDLRRLGLYQFAGAVMWVLHEVFGLKDDWLIAKPDERRGKLLLEEILKGGNFGKHSGLTNHNATTKYFLKIKRNMRFVCAYPAEALCEPWFRTWHYFWRLGYR